MRASTASAGTDFRLEFVTPAHDITYTEGAALTALELFGSGAASAVVDFTAADLGDCANPLGALADYDDSLMRVGLGRQFFGINGSNGEGAGLNEIRFGFASNDEPASTWAGRYGIGLTTTTIRFSPHGDCDAAGCGCSRAGANVPDVAANLWVR